MIWEERYHPLRKEWVVIAAHRQDRPWNTETVDLSEHATPAYVEDCYLCPGNARSSGTRNPEYTSVFVFDNDHPCVGPAAPAELASPPKPHRVRRANGVARVVCYAPEHHLTLAELPLPRVAELLRVWRAQYAELGERPEVHCVLIFENKGEVVGVSNPHPHCQIYATNFVMKTIEDELEAQREYAQRTGRALMGDIIDAERSDGRRVIAENDSAIAFVPYFARYAYEVYVMPKQSHPSLLGLQSNQVDALAEVLSEVVVRFDNLWRMPFPYIMSLHQAPTDGADHAHHHFHIQFQPPLRKPNLLKHLAGPEVGAGSFISDTSPEEKAAELRAVPPLHYACARRSEVAR